MNAIAIVGRSDAGKTTVACELISELSARGHRVGAIKHCPHGHEPGKTDSDTARMAAAGARVVVALSPDRVTTWETDGGTASLETLMGGTGGMGASCDVVIVEGYKSSDLPKIVVRRGDDAPTDGSSLENVIGEVRFAADEPVIVQNATVSHLADMIERPVEPDVGGDNAPLSLTVNDERIPLKPYVSTMLFRLVTALLSVLKGIPEDPDSVALAITKSKAHRDPT